MRRHLLLILFMALSGCGLFTDAATRIAYDIQANVRRLGKKEGSVHIIQHQTPSHRGQCDGPFTVQFDKVGALIIWCNDSSGKTISSHSTSYHSRFVDTRETFIIDKPAASILSIQIERIQGRAVITKVF
jgi:hypothetical protein